MIIPDWHASVEYMSVLLNSWGGMWLKLIRKAFQKLTRTKCSNDYVQELGLTSKRAQLRGTQQQTAQGMFPTDPLAGAARRRVLLADSGSSSPDRSALHCLIWPHLLMLHHE